MTVLYIIAALLELAPQFVNKFIMQWENCMGGNGVSAATVHFLIRTVQFRKYLKKKSSDLGMLTVLEILGEKKAEIFFLSLAMAKVEIKVDSVSSLNFRDGEFGWQGKHKKRQHYF